MAHRLESLSTEFKLRPEPAAAPPPSGSSGAGHAPSAPPSSTSASLTPAALDAIRKGVDAWKATTGDNLLLQMKELLMAAGLPAAASLPALSKAEISGISIGGVRKVISKLKLPFEGDLPPDRCVSCCPMMVLACVLQESH